MQDRICWNGLSSLFPRKADANGERGVGACEKRNRVAPRRVRERETRNCIKCRREKEGRE